jgi:hypothetical protein
LSKQGLSTWRPFSNTSRLESILEAIAKCPGSNKTISLYVFGDEFIRGKSSGWWKQ